MKEYKTEKNGKLVTLWDEAEGIGLQFEEGETFAGLTASVVIRDWSILETEDGVKQVSEVSNELREYARANYPNEFKELKQQRQ